MDFERYVELTNETAVYPKDYERDYVIHGLVNELGEAKRSIEMIANQEETTVPRKYSRLHVGQICKEMGDALWYLARLCDHFDFDIQLEESGFAQKTIDHEIGERKVEQALLSATKINGCRKKAVRDGADNEKKIKRCAKNILNSFQEAAHHLGTYNLEVVMRENIKKLFDRKERNVLHGSGDNR